ncbi:ABC transporter ATP-binding protein [Paenibacillus sp. FSL H8-0122]|uniref:ABC transporter ATP-binding protein n=1 Tax=Paenibacillus sp. FSL H8-0122 TaxID=2954510 RepID=UPI0030F77EE3
MRQNEIIKNVKDLFAPYKKNIIIISIVMIITSAGSLLNPWLTKQLIDLGIMNSDLSKTASYVLLLFLVFAMQQLLGLIQYHYYKDLSVRIPYDLNYQACKHVLSVRIKYFRDRNFSEVMSELFQDIANISSLTDTHFLTSFVNLFKIIAGMTALFLIDWRLTLIMLATIPVKVLFSSVLFRKQESVYRIIMQIQSRFSAWLGDGISGIVEIKMWGIINSRLIKLRGILEDSKHAKSRLMFYGYIDNAVGSFLSTGFTCILFLYGSWLIQREELTFGSLVSFISYSSLVFEPISIISYLITQISSIKPAFERFLKFLNTDKEEDTFNATEFSDSMDIEEIVFDNVSLAYGQDKILDQINFTLKRGERVAIIGFNGSGKTSIINLLLRFYEPTEGLIRLNGNDIKSYTIESYRALWSLMAQDTYLFNDTIMNNIDISGTLSSVEIDAGCVRAGAYSFIQDLPEKLNTRVGYNGTKLSGGQKQKVSLARTLTRKQSKILVLDEATSSYDYYSEQIFNEEVLTSNHYMLTIIITHRPEVLKKLDKIIYLERGQVIGVGTFEELYASSNGFKKMITSSQREEHQSAIYTVSN